MATVNYIISTCPKCGKRLFKDMQGSITIGSPLVKCHKCGTVSKTSMRKEWYNYPNKKVVYILPLLLLILFPIVGAVIGYSVFDDVELWSILCGIIGLIAAICSFANYAVRIFLSKKRMKNKEYLEQLFLAEELTPQEFVDFCSKI